MGECHELVLGVDEVWGKEAVEHAFLVREHIVDECDATGVVVAAGDAADSSECRCHEGHPVATDDHIRRFAAEATTEANPRDGIAGVEAACDGEVSGLRFGGVLCFAGKEEGRVLE